MHDCQFFVHKEKDVILINAVRYGLGGAAVKWMRRRKLAAEFSLEVASLLTIRHEFPRFAPLNFHVSTTPVWLTLRRSCRGRLQDLCWFGGYSRCHS